MEKKIIVEPKTSKPPGKELIVEKAMPNSMKKKEKKKVNHKVADALNVKGSALKKYFLSINPYALTILDPWNVHGVRIPDLVTSPSVPFTLVQRFTLTTNANGICGILLGVFATASNTNIVGLIPAVSGSGAAGDFFLGCTLGAGATSANLVNTVGGAPNGIRFLQWASVTSAVPALYTKTRLVSFGAAIQYSGQAINAQGVITLSSQPRLWRQTSIQVDGGLSIDTVTNSPGATVLSVPEVGGGRVIYKPIDAISTAYYDRQITRTSNAIEPEAAGGELYLVVTGAVANTTFLVTVVGNYEGIPDNANYMTTSLPVATSNSDPIALSAAMNAAAKAPNTGAKVPTSISSTSANMTEGHKAHSGHEGQESSMLETIMGGIDKIADVSGKVIKNFAPLAGTIAAIL